MDWNAAMAHHAGNKLAVDVRDVAQGRGIGLVGVVGLSGRHFDKWLFSVQTDELVC